MRSHSFVLVLVLTVGGVTSAQKQPLRGPGASPPPPADDGKLPEGVRLRLGSSKFRDPGYIQSASLSPDGKLIAITNGSQVIRFLDVATGKEDHRITLSDYPRSPQVAWSPDGTRIVMCGQQGVGVWDAKTGKLVKQAPNPNPNRGGQEGPVQVSDDGKFAAVGYMYENGMVRVVDLEAGNQVSAVKPAQNAGVFGALSPKGETLATWGQHYNRGNGKPEDDQRIVRTIQLWDAKEGKEKGALVADIQQIVAVRFSPDGAKVAAGGNGIVQLWDVATGKVERRFAGGSGRASSSSSRPTASC